jgi:hypothetical protein
MTVANEQNRRDDSYDILLDFMSVNRVVPCIYFRMPNQKEQWGRLGRSCRAQGAEGRLTSVNGLATARNFCYP